MNTELRNLNDTQRLELWGERVQQCRNSGKSVAQWCNENNLNTKTYYYWQSRLFKELAAVPSAMFVEVPTPQKEQEPNAGLIAAPALPEPATVVATIQKANIGINIYNGIDAATISAICTGLQIC